jgi:hypothetical protein
MWRLTSRFFLGTLASAMFTNAVAVYLLHDVDADRIGKWNLAYWELTREFFVFGLVVTILFFLLAWIGTLVFGLGHVAPNLRLGLILGIAVTLLQYPAEYIVRGLTAGHSADTFLLGYIVLSPISCASVVLMDAHKRRLVK